MEWTHFELSEELQMEQVLSILEACFNRRTAVETVDVECRRLCGCFPKIGVGPQNGW